MFLIVDAHEDLAYNILTFGRDYTLPAHEIRRREQGTPVASFNGDTLLGYPEYLKGRVAIVFPTLFASPARRETVPGETQTYSDFEQAHAVYRGQVEAYYRLVDEHPDHFHLIQVQDDLQETLQAWEKLPDAAPQAAEGQEEPAGKEGQAQEEQEPVPPQGPPVGLVILMEGAEGVRSPEELEEWWQLGVRVIGPAWAGTRFCGGTHEPGPLTSEGFALLEAMADIGFALDLSHMDEEAVMQSLDVYSGVIVASHANVLSLLKGLETNRHLSDRVLHGIIERDGVVGVVPCNSFLYPHWVSRDGREKVSLQRLIAHIDSICQMAGDALHVGLGTDFDGGFGVQSVPEGIDTIADLQKLAPLLVEKGYSDADVAAILGGNWIRILRRVLPESV
ncbi:MAG: dipeptidase [Omnitrophica WOR_2 bacterium]